MTPRQLEMLRAIQYRPRTCRSFTEGVVAAHPSIYRHDIDALEEYGYVKQEGRVYSITPSGERVLRGMPQIVQSRTITSYGMAGEYKPPKWVPARPGADDHKKWSRVGDPT